MSPDASPTFTPPSADPNPAGIERIAATPSERPAQTGAGDLSVAWETVDRIRKRLQARIKGRDDVIELVLIALVADGHVLLEDFPGSGKTTLAKALGESIEPSTTAGPEDTDGFAPIRRIQFTPDLLPADVTGTTIFDPTTNNFFFRPGPIFAHVVLADEINRTSPKVQAALLEAMAEKQVTVDNLTRRLDELFFVIATQNPLDLAGTFPLPSAQLDRFLFKIRMTHIDRVSELEVLATISDRARPELPGMPRVSRDDLVAARRIVQREVYVAPAIQEALVDIANNTRNHEQVLLGVSTRALVLMLPALQARAMTQGRHFVTADDVDALAALVFGHRVELAPGAESEEAVIADCCKVPLEMLARASLSR